MPEQLIFTSKPTGIQPGRSGFQVVAQHNTINPRLVAALEKESIYEFADSTQTLPVVCKYQKFEFANESFSVLTRMQSCGVDFTGRPNHIAHHLVFDKHSLPKCPPAAIFALWKGWRQKWDTKPRFLGGWDRVNYENETEPFFYTKFALPAKTWKAEVGDEGAAAIPVISETDHVLFPFPEGREDTLIWIFLESQSLIPTEKAWDITFTNYRIENDNLSRFKWIGCPKNASASGISLDSETVDVFEGGNNLQVPQHELAEKARTTLNIPHLPSGKRAGAAVSLALIEESGPIQDELELAEIEEPKPLKLQKSDELLESDFTSNLPDQHSDEVFDDIFRSDDDSDKIQIPNLDLQDEDSIQIPERSLFQRLKFPILGIAGLVFIILAIAFAPGLIELFNRKADPTPLPEVTGPSPEEIAQKERLAALQLDPDMRFASQIGEVDSIIKNGKFLLARAYLSKYRGDSEKSQSSDYFELENWYEQQKSTLEVVNRETGILAKQVSRRIVLPEFDEKMNRLESSVNELAEDIRPALMKSLFEIKEDYLNWLNKVRLKTENVPTFFIPISRDNPNPEITFEHVPDSVQSWLAGLDQFPVTAQIEHIRIQVSPFRGLNQFELSSQDAINLSLWKHSERSLISYLDGQTEVVEIISDPKDLTKISFLWRFVPTSTSASAAKFPEPPLILNFLNTLTNQALNIVMMGGVSQSVTTPAEVPASFLKLDAGVFKFDILDPVLKEKLELFILPPDRFLRLRSLDNRYLFAFGEDTAAFHLYESRDMDSGKVKQVQDQIAQQHALLNQLERQQTIYRSVDFVKNTPLWSLGKEVLPSGACPGELETYGAYFSSQGENYFEYLRAIMSHFAASYTLLRPSVLEKWVAYPKDRVPQTREAVITYRNMLLRTSKRFRSLLKQDDTSSLEYWRNFVTNIEFWLLGEHQDQLVDVLSLSREDIALSQQTDIQQVEQEIVETRTSIKQLQDSLETSSNLGEITNVDQWMLEMTSMQDPAYPTPLILFK